MCVPLISTTILTMSTAEIQPGWQFNLLPVLHSTFNFVENPQTMYFLDIIPPNRTFCSTQSVIIFNQPVAKLIQNENLLNHITRFSTEDNYPMRVGHVISS